MDNAKSSVAVFSQWSIDCLSQKGTPTAQASAISIAHEYFSNTSSPLKELALLLASIGDEPISSAKSSNISKLLALKYLLGSLQTFQKRQACLSLQMGRSVAQFLLQLCGPIVHDGDGISVDDSYALNASMQDINDTSDIVTSDDVRDAAIKCTSALLQIPLSRKEFGSDEAGKTPLSAFAEFRVQVAKEAVQKRCASLEDCMEHDDDDDYDDDDEYMNGQEAGGGPSEEEARTLSGLSLLPRAKRAICFRVLEAALQGIQCDVDVDGLDSHSHSSASSVVSVSCSNHLVDFVIFAATCLIGETDPRCLMQMLRLLFQMQSVVAPIVEEAIYNVGKGKDGAAAANIKGFPYTGIFDSVAVYYPVRFTPPPNDPHGITRDGISCALMNVLNFCNHSLQDDVVSGHPGQDDENASMVVLATGLFLERISPPLPLDPFGEDDEEERDVTTVRDRIEALEDLSSLLFVHVAADGDHMNSVLKKLTPASVKEMSNVLYRCHDNAAAGVASAQNEEEKQDCKMLADSCRHFVTRIEYDFERVLHSPNANTIQSFWDIFVKDRVKDLAGIIASSPQSLKGRMAIAYLASLSACGGEKTLRLCLDMCIPRLTALLDENIKAQDSNRDKEKMSTVVYGISVLFSSCRLSMERMSKDGINLYPHPLRSFGSRIVQTLCQIIEDVEGDSMDELEIAAVKALESVLLSTPASILNENDGDDTSTVRDTIFFIAKMLMADIMVGNDGSKQWKVASAQLVGSTIGKGLQGRKGGENNPNATLLESDEKIVSFVENTIFPRVIESSCQDSNEKDCQLQRYDWSVLAYACEADQEHAVYEIVSRLYSALVSTIQSSRKIDSEYGNSKVTTVSHALSRIIKSGGPTAILAFHKMSVRDDTGNDLIKALTVNSTGDTGNGLGMEEMSALLLPEKREEYRSQADCAEKLSHSILPHLLHAYSSDSVDIKQIEKIASRASQVLPPLSDWDGVELCTLLPVLSVALSSKIVVRNESLRTLTNILPDLVDYAMNGEVLAASRATAASCVFSIVALYQDNAIECIGLALLRNQIFPIIVGCFAAEDKSSDTEKPKALLDAMNLAAMIASAASVRGGNSAITADEVARFFALVACEGAVSAPALGVIAPLDCIVDNRRQRNIEISTFAATALGSLLSVNGSPFAKQRLAHGILPIVLSSLQIMRSSRIASSDIGSLLCVCHIICCVSVKALGQEKLENLALAIVHGLERVLEELVSGDESNLTKLEIVDQLISLLLAALVKLYNQSLSSVCEECCMFLFDSFSAISSIFTFFSPTDHQTPWNHCTVVTFDHT